MDAEMTFPAVSRNGQGDLPAGRRGLRPAIVVSMGALHLGVLAGLCVLMHPRLLSPPPAGAGIAVLFVPAAAERQLASGILTVPASEQPEILARLPALALPPAAVPHSAAAAMHHGGSHAAALAVPGSLQGASPPPAGASALAGPAVAAPAVPANDMLGALAGWEARIRQAVQNAAAYPAASRMLRRSGSAQVRFDYDRGAVERATIAQSSHVRALDDAAVAAVIHAAMPDPPAEIGPQQRTMLVWVQFRLVAGE